MKRLLNEKDKKEEDDKKEKQKQIKLSQAAHQVCLPIPKYITCQSPKGESKQK